MNEPLENGIGIEVQVGKYANGQITWITPKVKNLVTDWGMQVLNRIWFCDISKYVILGTSKKANRRPIVVTQGGLGGLVVTIDAGCSEVFKADDVTYNRLLIYPDGQQARIIEKLSDKVVRVDTAITKITKTDATVCFTEQDVCDAGLMICNNYDTAGGCFNAIECNDIENSITLRNTRSIIFDDGDNMTRLLQDLSFEEIGWAPFNTDGVDSKVFGRRVMGLYFSQEEIPYVRVTIYRKIVCANSSITNVPITDRRGGVVLPFMSLSKYLFNEIKDSIVNGALDDTNPIWKYCSRIDPETGLTIAPLYPETLLECAGTQNRYMICTDKETIVNTVDLDYDNLPEGIHFSAPVPVKNALEVIDMQPSMPLQALTATLNSAYNDKHFFGTSTGTVFSKTMKYTETGTPSTLFSNKGMNFEFVASRTNDTITEPIVDIKDLNSLYILVCGKSNLYVLRSATLDIFATLPISAAVNEKVYVMTTAFTGNTSLLVVKTATDLIYVTCAQAYNALAIVYEHGVNADFICSARNTGFLYVLTANNFMVYDVATFSTTGVPCFSRAIGDFIPKSVNVQTSGKILASGVTALGAKVILEFIPVLVGGVFTDVTTVSKFINIDLSGVATILNIYQINDFIYIVHTAGILSISASDIEIVRRRTLVADITGCSCNVAKSEISVVTDNVVSVFRDMLCLQSATLVDTCTLDLDAMYSPSFTTLKQIIIAHKKSDTVYGQLWAMQIKTNATGSAAWIPMSDNILAEFTVVTQWKRLP